MTNLHGKVALITGTAGGQGRAAAMRFAAAGATVVGCDIKEDEAAETESLVRDAGGRMESTAPLNLADEHAVKAWIDDAADRHGRLDILYNNASAARFVPMPYMDLADWRFTLTNELDLVFIACLHAWPHLSVRGGVIINTASTLGVRAIEGLGSAAHSAAKAGVIGLSRQLAVEGAPVGIRVNTVSPGTIETPATADVFSIPGARDGFAAMSPLQRVGTVDDVANAALFLAADESAFLTGVNLMVDGGATTYIKDPLPPM